MTRSSSQPACWARGLGTLIALALVACGIRAHDPVANPAVDAPCILQVFVEPGEIRAEIEIETSCIHAFRNVLPDKLYQELSRSYGFEERAEIKRRRRFFNEDLVIQVDGKPLSGEILDVRWAKKTLRHPLSTDPLPPSEQTGPRCLQASLRYVLPGLPKALSIEAPAGRAPGVEAPRVALRLYHRSVPAADFGMLEKQEFVHLDWQDAWFTGFDNPLFFRFNRDLLQIFLYVDALELRAEILFRPRDFEEFVDLGISGSHRLSVQTQKHLLTRLRSFLPAHLRWKVDHQAVEARLASLDLLKLRIGSTERLALDQPVGTGDTFVGAVFTLERSAWPKTVELAWDLYPKRVPFAIGTPVDVKEGTPVEMSSEYPSMNWENELETTALPAFRPLPSPPLPAQVSLPLPSLVLGLGGLALLTMILLGRRPRVTLGSLGLLCIAVSLLASEVGVIQVQDPRVAPLEMETEDAQVILETALSNIYLAYQFRNESRIYDGLAQAVDGQLLPKLYLQIRRSLEVSEQEGIMTKVDAVDLGLPTIGEPHSPRAFEAQCTWQVTGSVGHWGHWHRRFQEYQAILRMEVRNGRWKLTALDLQSERRL